MKTVLINYCKYINNKFLLNFINYLFHCYFNLIKIITIYRNYYFYSQI
mgnify:CR=1 FL=1